MNTWNVHRMKLQKNTWRLLSSGTKLFITFELKVIRHEESDTQSFYADFSICPPTTITTTTRGTPPQTAGLISASPESQPSSSDAKTQQTDFSQIPQILRARFRCMKSFTYPGHNSLWDFYFDISEWHILPACVWTPAPMWHLTHALSERFSA